MPGKKRNEANEKVQTQGGAGPCQPERHQNMSLKKTSPERPYKNNCMLEQYVWEKEQATYVQVISYFLSPIGQSSLPCSNFPQLPSCAEVPSL